MSGTSIYQTVRTIVKKDVLRRVVDLVGMEYAIRVSSPRPIDEVEQALREHLGAADFNVIHETDVKAIHNHYKLNYPEYRILKVVNAETLHQCPMASAALDIDPDSGVFLPPSIVLYELDGETRVSAVRPSTLLALFDDPDLRETVRDLEGVLWDALREGVPEATVLSAEPPLAESDRQGRIKELLHPVLNLLDAEFTVHVSTRLPRLEATEAVRDALTRRGQHVLGEVGEGSILLAINPGQAHKALAIDPDIGVFAPFSVTISEEPRRTHVRCVRPSTLLIFFAQPDMQDILLEMEMLLWNALTSLPDLTVHSRQPPLTPGTGQRTTGAGLPGGLGSLEKYRPG